MRKPLLDLSIRDLPFQLLPRATYPAHLLEKLLAWQERFAAAEMLPSGSPSFVILVETAGTAEQLSYLLQSLAAQSYPRFTICAKGDSLDGSDHFVRIATELGLVDRITKVGESAEYGAPQDDRHRKQPEERNQNESDDNSFVLLAAPGAVLHPSALFIIAKELQRNAADYVYVNGVEFSNVDLRTAVEYLRRPDVATTADSFLALSDNPMGDVLVLRTSLYRELSSDPLLLELLATAASQLSLEDQATFAPIYSKLTAWRMASLFIGRRVPGAFIPLGLFNQIQHRPFSPSEQELYLACVLKIVRAHGAVLGAKITGITALSGGQLAVLPELEPTQESVEVVIPFKNSAALTLRCLKSVELQSCVDRLSVTLVDNRSDPEQRKIVEEGLAASPLSSRGVILDDHGYFNFARLNNLGWRSSKHPYQLFLNNDVELSTPDAVTQLVSWCAIDGVGAVGGELRYPGGGIQSAGINFAAIRPKNVASSREGSDRLREVDAVSLAMAVVKRSALEAVGGLDERCCPNGFGDALLGVRLREKGFRVLFTPAAQALHHESRSRGVTPEEHEFWEMAQAGVPLAELYHDFQAHRQPERIDLRSLGERPLSILARGMARIPVLGLAVSFLARVVLFLARSLRARYFLLLHCYKKSGEQYAVSAPERLATTPKLR